MSTASGGPREVAARVRTGIPVLASLSSGNVRSVVERNARVIRNQNGVILVSGFFEPVLYLLAMGLGMGALVGEVIGPGGEPVEYAAYIAPALLATSAMNGAVYDSTWNVFFKLRLSKLYQAMLQTRWGRWTWRSGRSSWRSSAVCSTPWASSGSSPCSAW